jgi:hypothetical protein
MDPERRRNRRVAVDPDGTNAVLKGVLPVAVRDISPGGLRLALGSALAAGGVYPLTALLRGLSLAAPVRITRCRPGAFPAGLPGATAESWEAGAEFLWRDEADAAVVRSWLECKAPVAS